jgi:two-component system, chemotaxis family, sensor kinase CheA
MDDHEIIAEFVVESREHLADIENQLLKIEASGPEADVELVNTVFRAVHSIKGAAGFLGFSTVGHLAHGLENVLNLVRNRQLVPNSAITDVMLRSADKLKDMIENVDHSNGIDVSEYLNALQNVVSCLAAEEASPAEVASESEPAHPENNDGDIQSVETNIDSNANDSSTFVPNETVEYMNSQDKHSQSTPAPSAPEPRMESAFHPKEAAHEVPSEAPAAVAGDTNIRVSVNVLDRLMNLAGELVLSRNQLLQSVGASDDSGLDSVSSRLDQVTSELQEAIMQTRMQAVGTVFSKFPRVVRDLSNQLGKQCVLFMEGEDVELDKSVIEAIGDPLTHLIRNAVDHGMESPDARVRAGKPAAGKIVLRAFHQAGKVNISVADDGGGIDIAKVKEKAVSRGIVTPEQVAEMSDREALRLLFRPGFSMAEKVTSVSGRGVGMDVVKTNIEKLGGAVTIDTKLGQGSTIDIKLPLTLAIIPSLIVRCRENRFAIPQTSISELVRVKAGDSEAKIERIKNAEVFRLRGNLLPLIRLDSALNLKPQNAQDARAALHIIVVEAGHIKYGLIVDGLHDSEEIVVKPLGRHMQDCRFLAGATVLGDGKVALILDVSGIAVHARLAMPDEDKFTNESNQIVERSDDSQLMLLFTNAPDEQFGVPMQVITRLERVRGDQIDSVGGLEMLQYRGGSLPLLSLENYVRAVPKPPAKMVYVLVYGVAGREIGLVVPKIIDIRQVSTEIDVGTLCEPGIIGSIVVNKKITRLLDLFQLTRIARPDWFENQQQQIFTNIPMEDQPERKSRLLLAEDSHFFRKQVAGFLEAEGYEVVACEDGLVAWNYLQTSGDGIDLVVTDIEMPNMDGFQLSRNIKDDSALCRLPVIALTSLASEEDIRRGQESGVDDYQIKLDRDKLMATVSQHLKTTIQNAGLTFSGATSGAGR